jgi:DNA replication protein DnaC
MTFEDLVVSLARSYTMLTEDTTRVMNRLKAIFRGQAVGCAGKKLYAKRHRAGYLAELSTGGLRRRTGMSMEAASIAQDCKTLRLAAIGAQFASLAEEASQQNHSHLHYLEALLQAEVEDRERRSIELRIKDAHLPRMKTLEEFDFAQSPHIPASRIRALSEGGYLERSEPVLLVGEPGTGKTHLATGLAIAACRQRKRVRFTTAAALVNQLVEAQREQSLTRILARWSRVELIVIDEIGYVPLAEVAAELLFQVIAERAERAAIIVTTNLPFSEWPQVFTNARLCKAVLDRLTDQASRSRFAHICCATLQDTNWPTTGRIRGRSNNTWDTATSRTPPAIPNCHLIDSKTSGVIDPLPRTGGIFGGLGLQPEPTTNPTLKGTRVYRAGGGLCVKKPA